MMGFCDSSFGFGWMPFGWIMMIGFWGLIIFGIAWLVREMSGKNKTNQKDSLDILKERYAKGEIEREEFERMKKDITNK